MKHRLIFALIAVLSNMAPMAFAQPSENQYPTYVLNARIDTDRHAVTAEQTVSFTNTTRQPLAEIYFHIYPNREFSDYERLVFMRYASFFKVDPFPDGFETSEFRMRSVRAGGKALSYVIEGQDASLLKVVLPEPLQPGEDVSLHMDFTLTVPHAYGRFGWHDGIMTLSRWYPLLSVVEEGEWQNYLAYPFHRPFYSQASRYEVEVSVPKGQTLVTSGKLVEEPITENGWTTYRASSEAPLREWTMAVSDRFRIMEDEFNGVTLRAYYLPGTEKHTRKALNFAEALFSYYTQRFGPYPYSQFNIVPAHLGYGGEQMANMIFIDTRVFELPAILDRYFDFLIAHEAGHQWFFNILGINEYQEIWLEEGANSYFISEYINWRYGEDADVLVLPEWAKKAKWFFPDFTFKRGRETRYQALARIGLDSQVVKPLSHFHEPSSIFAIAYGKGSRIYSMLRDIMGEEAFARAWETIFEKYRFDNLSVAEFIAECERQHGESLDWFFDPWLKTKDYLDLAVKDVEGQTIEFGNKGQIVMPAEVRITWADGDQKTVMWDQRTQGLSIDAGGEGKIKRVEVDPQQKLLELDRTNNDWPRRINFIPVPLYHGLYDVSMIMPDDGYNVVFGPELANSGLGVKASIQKPYEHILYAGTDWEFSEEIHHSRIGYQVNNVFQSQTAVGFEIANRKDYKDGNDDLASGKVYWRHELWPVPYSLNGINDHVTLYLIRNQGLEETLIQGGEEGTRNISYKKDDEAIVGVNLHLSDARPAIDPSTGFRLDLIAENAGHFLGATEHFYRSGFDLSFYRAITNTTKLALRFKYGWGWPDDKNLYEMGGIKGLRGYDRKTIRGANAYLGSVEYRFPIYNEMDVRLLDNIISFEDLGGVIFFDGGQAWYDNYDTANFKKDAGIGLRVKVNIGSYFEQIMLRADVAWAINDPSEDDPKFWFGVNHAF